MVKSNSKDKEVPKKAPKRKKRSSSNRSMDTYSSLVYKSKVKADKKARKRADDLADLPKNPVKRFFARLHPKRVFRFIFSMRGVKFFLKCGLALFLLAIIAIGGLFLYYKKDLDAIKLEDLQVADTVNTYLDRNGEVLWEDKGDGDYRLVVEGDQISTYMRQATVAIEDKNFYNHMGVDLWATIRAAIFTVAGKGVQGGSTLTQQLIKQVYFSDESKDRTVTGIPRKIKEAILSLEIEKMYDKEELITMYLNESPYGGRRNGVESAAQTYFGKSAKDLTLAESALLAAIPNNPAVLNPYNIEANQALIERQHKVLNSMVEMEYITQEQADEAKSIAVLDTIKPEVDQYENIKAPHFVLAVKDYLEDKYGVKTMRSGGYMIKTTLDYNAQKMAEAAVAAGAEMRNLNGSDNIAMASVDVETSQVIAMVGSVDWNVPGYGEVNAATALLEPGSTIKPVLDYGPLMMQRTGQNYAPGTILKDENIDAIYCAGYTGSCKLRNYTGAFYGNVTIRKALANSLNIPAVKALYINGIENSLEVAHNLGEKSYCADAGSAGGLSIAIGSGCNIRLVEHANTYASISRGGTYKDIAYILELKNSAGEVIESWQDSEGTRVYDEQVAYMVSNILGDAAARNLVFGSMATSYGFKVPNVWTASKTGTTTTANSSQTKDSLMISYSPVVSTVVWNGNHDGSALWNSSNDLVRRVINNYMSDVHLNLYEPAGRWTKNQEPVRPEGITIANGDIWPSWYNARNSGMAVVKLTFNKYTKMLASECTPADQKITIDATKMLDPITNKEVWTVPDGYNRDKEDDCSYKTPTVNIVSDGTSGLKAIISKGSRNITGYSLAVNGVTVASGAVSGNSVSLGYKPTGTEESIQLIVKDELGYEATDELSASEISAYSGGAQKKPTPTPTATPVVTPGN
ncbi:MAG: transglycosylase domain-containing protein [Candidatus Saccharibacteria bacterium]|nr:transglycosylase domain-containing protein [Candidatus Saccharibacteria bacterium]